MISMILSILDVVFKINFPVVGRRHELDHFPSCTKQITLRGFAGFK